jgi:hypothetical protein
VFAGIITIIGLQLRLPHHPTFSAFLEEWPTALSYIVSYFLIVIMWINHRYLWGFAEHSTPKLILWNGGPCVRLRGRHHFVKLSYHAFAYEVVPRVRAGEIHPVLRRSTQRQPRLALPTVVVVAGRARSGGAANWLETRAEVLCPGSSWPFPWDCAPGRRRYAATTADCKREE